MCENGRIQKQQCCSCLSCFCSSPCAQRLAQLYGGSGDWQQSHPGDRSSLSLGWKPCSWPVVLMENPRKQVGQLLCQSEVVVRVGASISLAGSFHMHRRDPRELKLARHPELWASSENTHSLSKNKNLCKTWKRPELWMCHSNHGHFHPAEDGSLNPGTWAWPLSSHWLPPSSVDTGDP